MLRYFWVRTSRAVLISPRSVGGTATTRFRLQITFTASPSLKSRPIALLATDACPCMRHATGLSNVSGLRTPCTAFCSVQAATSATDESEQIKIKAVSILFPLAFFGGLCKGAARTRHPTERKKEL